MVRRTSLTEDYCPSARALDAIGDWWSLLIVRDAFDGLTRFGEFQKSLGIAKNILADRLRTLVDRGILDVVPTSEGGARRQYLLTAKGRDLFPVMVALRQWGESHMFAPDEKRSRTRRARDGPARSSGCTDGRRPPDQCRRGGDPEGSRGRLIGRVLTARLPRCSGRAGASQPRPHPPYILFGSQRPIAGKV